MLRWPEEQVHSFVHSCRSWHTEDLNRSRGERPPLIALLEWKYSVWCLLLKCDLVPLLSTAPSTPLHGTTLTSFARPLTTLIEPSAVSY